MTVTITVSLLTADPPAPVQVVVDGIPDGDEFAVIGTTGDFTWPVNGGAGVSDGEQLVLIDLRSPLNVPVEYAVVTPDGTVTSTPVTVTYPADFIVQLLSGKQIVAPLTVADSDFAREYGVRQTTFDIPGRSRPVIRFDTTTDGTAEMKVTTDRAGSGALVDLVRSGAPVVYRQVGVRDLPPVDVILFTSIKATSPQDDYREWALAYVLVDDPEPGVAAVWFTWDTFDEIYAGVDWDAFDTEWSGSTWAEFDRTDWGQYL